MNSFIEETLIEFRENYSCLDYITHKRVVGEWDDNTTPHFIELSRVEDFMKQKLIELQQRDIEIVESLKYKHKHTHDIQIGEDGKYSCLMCGLLASEIVPSDKPIECPHPRSYNEACDTIVTKMKGQ